MNLSIRANGRDEAIIEAAKGATGERTAAKALLAAAGRYPRVKEDLREKEAHLRRAEDRWFEAQRLAGIVARLEEELAGARAQLADLLLDR